MGDMRVELASDRCGLSACVACSCHGNVDGGSGSDPSSPIRHCLGYRAYLLVHHDMFVTAVPNPDILMLLNVSCRAA